MISPCCMSVHPEVFVFHAIRVDWNESRQLARPTTYYYYYG
jgi:hypothetical protein